MKVCRHCTKASASRSRGLCCRCFKDKGVRELYPSKNPGALNHPECWACGTKAPRRTHLGAIGWHTRKVDLGWGIEACETYCPGCYRTWGWPDWAALVPEPDGG